MWSSSTGETVERCLFFRVGDTLSPQIVDKSSRDVSTPSAAGRVCRHWVPRLSFCSINWADSSQVTAPVPLSASDFLSALQRRQWTCWKSVRVQKKRGRQLWWWWRDVCVCGGCPCNPVREQEIRLAVWCRYSEEIFYTALWKMLQHRFPLIESCRSQFLEAAALQS